MEQTAMTPEMWTMIAGFVGLAGLIFAMTSRLDRRMDRMEDSIKDLRAEMNTEFKAVRTEMAEEFKAVRTEMAARFDKQADAIANLGDRVGRVEGELKLAADLLRDLLVRRNTPGANPEQAD